VNAEVLQMAPRESAQEQARQWIVRIDAGALDTPSRAELRAWLAADPLHAQLLDEHALLWSSAAQAAFPAPSQPSRSAAPGGWWGRPRWAGSLLGLAVVLAAGAGLWLNPGPLPEEQAKAPVNMSTARGQQEKLTLEDGSRMHLNTASAAQVALGDKQRRVVLDRGEAYFDVAKDPSRPFEVVAGHSIVRAVGTRFAVRRLDERRVEVTVFEGLVEVLRPAASPTSAPEPVIVRSQPLRLAAGQQALDAGDQIVLKTLAPEALEQRLAWQQGRIVFDATPLPEAVEQVNRYSDRPLRLSGSGLQSVKVSGAFSTQDVSVFLRSLEQGFGLHVEQGTDAVLITATPARR